MTCLIVAFYTKWMFLTIMHSIEYIFFFCRFGIVCNVFHHHGLTSGENDVVLDASEANDIVSDILFAASKGRVYHTPPMDVEALTAAALKYAFLIFDNKGKARKQFVNSRSVTEKWDVATVVK